MRPILLYLALTTFLSAFFWALIIISGHVGGAHGSYAFGVMWCPGIAALLTCALLRLDFAPLGWNWRPLRWQVLAYLTPLAFCTVGYGAVWASGLGGFPNMATVASLQSALGISGLGTRGVILLSLVLTVTAGTLRSLSSALGEEIGWRGFLTPRLAARIGFTRGALLTGAIWGLWHFPILLFADYDSASPVWFSMPCFVVEVLGLSVIMLWLRLRSGSLWTGALLHASVNLFNQGVFAPLTAERGKITAYAIDESGFVLPVVITLTALVFWLRRHEAIAAAATRDGEFARARITEGVVPGALPHPG